MPRTNSYLERAFADLPPNSKILGMDFNAWLPHNFATLEILAHLSEQGHRSHYFQEVSNFLPMFGKPYFGKSGLIDDTTLREFQIAKLVPPNDVFSEILTPQHFQDVMSQLRNSTSLNDLKQLNIHGLEIGYPLISSVTSEYKNSNVPLGVLKRRAGRFLSDYVNTYNLSTEIATRAEISALLIFNGRFVREHAAAEAFKRLSIPVYFHESSEPETFSVGRHKPHCTIGAFQDYVDAALEFSPEDVSRMGEDWFLDRVSSKSPAANRFHKNWRNDLGEYKASKGAKTISIFPTSDEEFLGLSSEWDLPGGKTQIEWLASIAETATRAGMRVVIRLHPNLQRKSSKLKNAWLSLGKTKSVTVIDPESNVNSYKLIQSSDLVITCGSTIAAEATFLKVPVLSVGAGVYDQFNVVKKSTEALEINNLIVNSDYSDLIGSYENALSYGFYEKRRKLHRSILTLSNSSHYDEFQKPSLLNRLLARIYLQYVLPYLK